MRSLQHNQNGSHLIAALLAIVVLGVIGFAGWRVFTKSDTPSEQANTQNSSNQQTNQQSQSDDTNKQKIAAFMEWNFTGERWLAPSGAPSCEASITIDSPADLTVVTSKLLPGQFRGGNYKAHGGLAKDNAVDNSLTVTAVRDAYLYRGSRYIEAGEVQYMFDFMDPCGLLYRLDHLATLTPEFQAYADQLPEAKPDDSRTTKFSSQPLIAKGTTIATEVGFKANKNAGFDFGLYDLRQQNKASQAASFSSDPKKSTNKELPFFGVCWFDFLSEADQSLVDALPNRDSSQTTSDYCND